MKFTVGCNRSLCNDNSTLDTIKKLMFKYKITMTSDGRLIDKNILGDDGIIVDNGLKLIPSVLLMIIMIFSFSLN